MLDINFIRANLKELEKVSKQKGVEIDYKLLLKLDDQRRDLIAKIDELRKRRNEIANLLKDPKQRNEQVMSEGKEYYVKPGDIVCTKAGDEHDVLEVYEDLAAFWLEDATPSGGRTGHLHLDEVKAKGHPVPAKPLPKDFSQ